MQSRVIFSYLQTFPDSFSVPIFKIIVVQGKFRMAGGYVIF